MHAVFADGLTVIWWNASATFRVYYAGREILAFTHYDIETLGQAQSAAKDWYSSLQTEYRRYLSNL